jgi:malate permease and related proteins
VESWGVLTVLTLLAPIFLLIALGAALQKGDMIGPEGFAGINRLLYWVGLPAAVFHSLATAGQVGAAAGGIMAVLALGTLVVVALVLGLGRLLGVVAADLGTFLQAGFRGNLSFVALPLILTVPGIPQAAAVLALAPILVVYNAIAVMALLMSRPQPGRRVSWAVVTGISRNPIILASLVGWGWHALGWPLGSAMERTLGALAQMALPLALLTVGAALLSVPLRGRRAWALATALCKTLLSPLVGYLIGRVWGLGPGEMLTVLLCMACPTAAVSYTMVKQLGGDEGLAATGIVFSTVLSLPALVVVLVLYSI